MGPFVVAALVLWLPGALLHRAFGVASGRWGAGTSAVEVSLSLGFLSLVLLPLYLLRAPVVLAPVVAAAATAALGAWALLVPATRRRLLATRVPEGDASRCEIVAFVVAIAMVVPAMLACSGANVDDWWDLSLVRGWIADGRFGFSQMALSPEPESGSSAVHPRFLWSVWLMVQALLAPVTGAEPWKVQAGALAAITGVLVLSAQAALAHALFRGRADAGRFAAATTLAAAAWIWGTDAFPLFVRGYQDKLFTGFVLAPVLIAVVLDALAAQPAGGVHTQDRDLPGEQGRPQEATRSARRAGAAAVAAVAIATVSVHSLVFTMALFVSVLAVVARGGRDAIGQLAAHRAVVAALFLPALYPLAQSILLATTFSEQGVSLVVRDNPVVRAHLSLNRLFGDMGPAWIVRPSAVFGSVAWLAVIGFAFAWRRRASDGAARVLVATASVPCVLLFVPGVAALAGTLWVPWMLYRLGWLVPVAPLLAYALVSLAPARPARRRSILAAAFAVAVVVMATTTATDRLRRDMDDHPSPPPKAPAGSARAAFEFLAAREGRDAVFAPQNFSELVPALSGKPVVAFSERGTLVFSSEEARAYERLRDRATFFAAGTSAAERDALAVRYGVRWAVLPRRLVASGSERAWMRRFGPEALLAARRCDDSNDDSNGARCGWWSASRAGTLGGLTSAWSVVLENRDFFVVERTGSAPAGVAAARATGGEDAKPAWLRPFALTTPQPVPDGAELLAAAAGSPGAVVTYDIAPRFVLPSVLPVWLEGPSPWEDVPAEVSVTLDLGAACTMSAVEVVPHLPRERRDVLEVVVDGQVARAAARHGEAIVVATPPRALQGPKDRVTVHVRSLLGVPVSLADVRVLGVRSTCADSWPVVQTASAPQMVPPAHGLLDAAAAFPSSGRPLVSLARRAASNRVRIGLLEEASAREPSLVEAWLDLGFAYDTEVQKAAASGSAAGAADARRNARRAFRAAVRADSHSAWAQGSAAWSDHRQGHTVAALWRAIAAANLDPLYGDAWTIAAYALGDLRLHALAERALTMAEHDDPDRNWPALARADLALARYAKNGDAAAGAVDSARDGLRSWIRRHPFDTAVRDKLSELVKATQRQDDAPEPPAAQAPPGDPAQ